MSSRSEEDRETVRGTVSPTNEVELVELGEGGLEGEIAASGLEPLHDVGGAGVEDALAGFDKGVADGAEDMGFAGAGVADGDEIGAGLDPVPGGQGLDVGTGHPGQGLEVEGGEGLAARELGLVQVAQDAPGVAFGQLELGQSGEEARCRPTLGVGAVGQRLPMAMETGQAQRGEHDGQRMDIDGARGCGGGHA